MNRPDPNPSPHPMTRLVGMFVVVVLVGGAAYALRDHWPGRPATPATPAEAPDPVGRALALAADTTRRDDWQDEVQGIDAAVLDPAHRAEFLRIANTEPCACGCGYTVAACRAFDPTCDLSLPRARRMLDSLVTLQARGR